jgi:DNA-binding MarR family transcriptional regulator
MEILQIFYRIDLASEALHAAGSRVHEPILPGSKPWLARVLRALYMAPGRKLSHADIAKETGVPPANITYQVDALRDEGYVRRVPHESDRRITLVELTDEGESLCDVILPAWARFITEVGGAFTEAEKRSLNKILERLESIARSYRPQLEERLAFERNPQTNFNPPVGEQGYGLGSAAEKPRIRH